MLDSKPVVQTERLHLYFELPGWEHAIAHYAAKNLAHLKPWEPPTPDNFMTVEFHAQRLLSVQQQHERGETRRFVMVLPNAPEVVVGRMGFSTIVRGGFHSCMLGYSIDAQYQGKGYMFEALSGAIEYMFKVEKLHRIQANYRTDNLRSAAVLKRLGFAIEGQSKDYLFIDGQWRDHVLTALLNSAWNAAEHFSALQ